MPQLVVPMTAIFDIPLSSTVGTGGLLERCGRGFRTGRFFLSYLPLRTVQQTEDIIAMHHINEYRAHEGVDHILYRRGSPEEIDLEDRHAA